jgi:hypothetical protein
MYLHRVLALAVVPVILWTLPALAGDSGRLYGKIETVDGDVFEGLIRWDKNEGSWVDILNGEKEIPRKYQRKVKESQRRKYRDRQPTVKIFGLEIGGEGAYSENWFGSASSGIRFGHIKSIESTDDDGALIVTKSGLEVELSGGSTDIGSDIREIVIEDRNEDEIELVWDDIRTVEFMPCPASDRESTFGDRLYGTLTTRRGEKYTGFVSWDVDELFTGDVLDGEDRDRSRKVKFGKISAIERYSSSGATVTLVGGEHVLLRETNDVDDSNRGISIADPGFGQVTVEWDEFDKLEFSKAPSSVNYSEFDGGKPLHGTVYTADGSSYTGTIRWDNDEEYTWELLDGDYRDVQFDIEFGKIRQIEQLSSSTAVTFKDGRTVRLSGSNDVDDENRGIFITTTGGDEVEVDWEDFEKVVFDN